MFFIPCIAEKFTNMSLASWNAAAISCLVWVSLYQVIRYNFKMKSAEWCNRIVTLLHGLITSVNGLPHCLQNDEWVHTLNDSKTTKVQLFILVISLGYFIFDLIWCLTFESETDLMVLHHICSCVIIYRILITETSGAKAVCGLGALEITNPYLQLRWFLRSEGFYNTYVFNCVEIFFFFLFVFVRLICGSIFYISIMFLYDNTWELRILSTVIYVLSWAFLYNILRFIYYKYLTRILENFEEEFEPGRQEVLDLLHTEDHTIVK